MVTKTDLGHYHVVCVIGIVMVLNMFKQEELRVRSREERCWYYIHIYDIGTYGFAGRTLVGWRVHVTCPIRRVLQPQRHETRTQVTGPHKCDILRNKSGFENAGTVTMNFA